MDWRCPPTNSWNVMNDVINGNACSMRLECGKVLFSSILVQ